MHESLPATELAQFATLAEAGTELLDRQQLECLLGLEQGTLYKLDKSGRGPPMIRIGRRVFYARRDIEMWLSSLRRVPQQPEG